VLEEMANVGVCLSRVVIFGLVFLFICPAFSASTYYDVDATDDVVWESRVPVVFREYVGVDRINETVALSFGNLFGDGFDYNKLDVGSIRVVDPTQRSALEVNGLAIPYQIDSENKTINEYHLIFQVDTENYTNKTYYVYFSPAPMEPPSYTTDLNFSYDGSMNLVVENDLAEWEGFSNGYFTLFRAETREYGKNIAYRKLGLDHGYSIESFEENSTNIRYANRWSCRIADSGPIRLIVNCSSYSDIIQLEKKFVFYSGVPYYDTENTISKTKAGLTNVKWTIYDLLEPAFSDNETGGVISHEKGSGDQKWGYMAARDVENGGENLFIVMGRGDLDFFFDEKEDFDSIRTVLHLGPEKTRTGYVRHMFIKGGRTILESQYSRFKYPLEVKVNDIEENRLSILEPNSDVVYDVVVNRSDWLATKVEIPDYTGVKTVECSLVDPSGEEVYGNISLVNDGSHGDEVAGDDVWTNNKSIKVLASDRTGLWTVNCTAYGAQSVPVSYESNFYVTFEGGYRRIEFFNLYCRVGYTFKKNPVLVRPGSSTDLHICLMNTGNQDESNVRFIVENFPIGWNLEDKVVDLLLRGDEVPVVLKVFVPATEEPAIRNLSLVVLANDSEVGRDDVVFRVYSPKLTVDTKVLGSDVGVTVSAADKPLSSISVDIVYPSGESVGGVTDLNGWISFPLTAESGTIEVTASGMGYNATSVRLTVKKVGGIDYWFLVPVAVLMVVLIHAFYRHYLVGY